MLKNKKSYYLLLAICMLVLCTTGIKWSLGLQSHLDLLLADEAEYLRNGLNLFGKIAKNWGPTYNLWYKGLSLFNSNPVSLYYLNYKIGAVGVGLLLFVFLVRYNVHLVVAFLIAFCYLFSDVNMNAWPRISNFVLIIYLLYFILIRNYTSTATRIILFAIVTFVAAFARPELLIIAEASSAISLFFVLRETKNIRTTFPLLLLLFATAFMLFFVYGKPADTYSNINRTYIAFCQHYAIAFKIRTHSNPNAIIEWIDFTKPLFGDCKTVPEILMKHLDLCIPHFLFTTKMYVITFSQFVLNFVVPLYLFKSMKKKLFLVFALLLFIVVVLFNKNIRTSFIQKIKEHKIILLLAFALSLPSIGICVIIFPRQHYIMMQAIWVALLLGFLLTAVVENLKINTLFVLPLAMLLFLISPKATKFKSIQVIPEITNLCTQKSIHFMNTQTWQEKQTIFSNILNVHLLFNHPEKFEQFNTEYMLKQLPKDVQFKDILVNKKIDIIWMNDALKEESRLKIDTSFINFVANPEKYNFKKVFFANDCQTYLLIKE